MTPILTILALTMFLGGLWVVTQSAPNTQWPIPIAVGGFILRLLGLSC